MQRKQIYTIDSSFSALGETFTTLEGAMAGGKASNLRRREELNLDLTPIKGKPVKHFHWDKTRLVLEFDEFLFLRMESIDDLLDVRIVSEHTVETDEELVIEQIWGTIPPTEWHPREIALAYTGKIFQGVYLNDRYVFLYFKEMKYLIWCHLAKIQEHNIPVIVWDESE